MKILDLSKKEIEENPEIDTILEYDYIETGSLISIKKNVENILIPSEERHIKSI